MSDPGVCFQGGGGNLIVPKYCMQDKVMNNCSMRILREKLKSQYLLCKFVWSLGDLARTGWEKFVGFVYVMKLLKVCHL